MGPADARPVADEPLAIDLALADAPGQVQLECLRLPAGATVADALRASTLVRALPAAQLDALVLARWGKPVAPEAPLHAHDRLELLRGLLVDPKEARRLRYRRDGVRKPARRPPR